MKENRWEKTPHKTEWDGMDRNTCVSKRDKWTSHGPTGWDGQFTAFLDSTPILSYFN